MALIPPDHPAVRVAEQASERCFEQGGSDPEAMAAALTAARPLLSSSEHLHKALAEMTIAYAKAMMALERYGQHIKPCGSTYAGVDCICGLYITLRDLGAE